MYFNKGNLWKFMFGCSILLTVTVTLIFIIQKDNADVQKHATLTMPQEKSASSSSVRSSNKNRAQGEEMSSIKIKGADEIDNLQHTQSQLLEKIAVLESKVSKLMENQYPTVTDEDSDYFDKENEIQKHEGLNEEVLGPIADEIDLKEIIQSEPVDAKWSDSAIGILYESIEEKSNESIKILNVDCRSTFCRVELLLSTTSEEEGLEELEKISPPWKSEGLFKIDEIDPSHAVMYIAREGHSLPRL